MSFLSGILDIGRSAVKLLSGNSLLGNLAKTALLGFAVRKLSQNAIKDNDIGTQANIDAGVRLQAKPNAAAKIPVLYGSAFFGGNLTDAALTNANKTMWYCLVLSEKTGNVFSTSTASSYVLNNVYWNNQRIVFSTDGVTANYTIDSTGVIDRNISGQVKVYFYAGGRTLGQKPSGFTGTIPNAETLFPNWTAGTHAMNNLVFALVRVDYNRERNITGLGDVLFHVTNSMLYPGDVLYDYLTNTTYGAGISSGDILTADITALNTYSQESVAYDSPTGVATLADRYQINGLIDTDKPVLQNAEKILSAAASWLSYDSHEGRWGVVINKDSASVASFNDSNILGNISLSGTGLQDLYNSTKVEFPHRELRDSADYYNIAVPTSSIPADWTPFSRNANEEDNVLNLSYDIINEPVQAQMLGLIELKQSRLDKVIQFQTDFSYYNLKAGDIISVTNSRFGFSSELFRIITINEVQDDGGALLMEITALQYNTNVYSIDDLYRFVRTTADGIISFGAIGQPGTPVVTKIELDSRPRVEITSTAPTGIVEGMEFWLTTDVGIPDDANRSYTLIGVKKPVGGGVYTSGTSVTLEYVTNASDFYVKTRGFNTNTVGSYSNVSGLVEFEPVQITDGINPDTELFDSTGGLLGALALIELLTKLSDLFPGGTGGKSIFDRIFDIFKDETGVDIVGQAGDGSLVVEANLETKADGASLGATTTSYDFIGPIDASGTGAITVKLEDGIRNKDILAWNQDEGRWQTISDCIDCEFENIPPPKGPEEPCSLTINARLPANNFQGVNDLCPNTTSVPYVGSYFLRYSIFPGREGAEPQLASTLAVANYQWTIAKAGNTDWTWFGSPNNTVGTKFTYSTPATNFPNGKTVKEITVGKRYKIKALKAVSETLTTQQIKAKWTSIGWVGATSTSNPTVGDEFTATAQGDWFGTVDFVYGTGWVYGLGPLKDNIPLVAPLVKGSGSFKLYGTDGILEQSVPIANCIIHNNVIEIPFRTRQPGKDYYVIWEEGIVTNCSCENPLVDNAETWTFTTSETPVSAYVIGSILPTSIADFNQTDQFTRTDVDFTFTPSATICINNQRLILTFSFKMKKGTGNINIVDRLTGTNVASLSVSSANITYTYNDDGEVTSSIVDFGAITGIVQGRYYDVTSPRGILLTDYPARTEVVCDKTYNYVARPDRKSVLKYWGLYVDEPLRVIRVEYCPANSGLAKKRTNIRVVFNKPIKVKEDSPAEVSIFGPGGLFQKIDLRGTYANKKYGEIYEVEDSAVDDPDTATVETVNNSELIVNTTRMMAGSSNYYMTIPSGVIIDATCDYIFPGVSDSTTIAWSTDGAKVSEPEGLTYGSVLLRFKYNRPVVPGYAKLNVITPAGRLKTQISANDPAVRISNQPFED